MCCLAHLKPNLTPQIGKLSLMGRRWIFVTGTNLKGSYDSKPSALPTFTGCILKFINLNDSGAKEGMLISKSFQEQEHTCYSYLQR